ncbi:hypothetical protein GCM10007989_27470 [Devosia pacifica]|uniref:Uncharacterized protein n=1 Tax=Devosia pacifica TaxID=1335967 RepID=A0A918VUI6_9HYPH|nr:hypothetical protein [Devosia pacifica]GHA30259.1 hypothetical protein GCM10007989_27470 [Devosia pacifica]
MFKRPSTWLAGGLLALGSLLIQPVIFAQEDGRDRANTIDPIDLIIADDRAYLVHREPWVDETVQKREVVRKIGYGRSSYVTIDTTSTGTYSTDGLVSSHVQYPGIEVEDLGHPIYWVARYLRDGAWVRLPFARSSSFVYYDRNERIGISSHRGGPTCVWTNNLRVC